jgi:hypothetical protein
MATPNLLAATSLTQTLLASIQLASGAQDAYVVPANKAIKVASGSLCNTSASTVTVDVSVVPSAGSVDGTHLILKAIPIAVGDTISQEDILAPLKGLMLGQGDKISINASAATAVDFILSGVVTA